MDIRHIVGERRVEMRREQRLTGSADDSYLFRYPLTQDGVNQGNLPESQYIGSLRNYGSTGSTSNFNDNLVFDTNFGELAHRHTGCADKLVSLIDYSNFDLGEWMNNNDFELNLDFYFDSYYGYQQIFEMMRNPSYMSASNYAIGFDGRWLNNTFGYLSYNGTNSPLIDLKASTSTYVTKEWVRFNVVKQSGNMTITHTGLGNGTTLSEKTVTAPTFATGKMPRYFTLFGFYLEGSNANNGGRYTTGATKNFYMKKL